MSLVSKLLRKNISPARIAGFILSNFLGLAIVLGGLQFYLDARSIWEDDDSFISSDYLVINKRVTSENTISGASSFSDEEIADLNAQPWVRRTAPFTSADFRIFASLMQGGRGMSTNLFFEAIPSSFVDVPASQWAWREGSDEVPLIISKDYLTLYNFGFAGSAGLPQMSEGLMSGIPLTLTLRSEDGSRTLSFHGRIAGYSNRLNTILVPQEFMDWANRQLVSGSHPGLQNQTAKPGSESPKRIIVEVSSPGDVAISRYMQDHDWEIAGDKSASSASFLLKVVVGIVLAIGVVITLLSLFILMLSISLLLEKNRDKIHSLLMLGYDTHRVASPYRAVIIAASVVALVLAIASTFLLRGYYLPAITGLGAEASSVIPMSGCGVGLTLVIILLNLLSLRRKITRAFRL